MSSLLSRVFFMSTPL